MCENYVGFDLSNLFLRFIQILILVFQLKLDELEMKYKKVMVSNAQLDNEKQANQYQIELLKEQVGDLEEERAELKRQLQHATHVSGWDWFSLVMTTL